MELEFDRAKWQQDGDGFWLSIKVRSASAARRFMDKMKQGKLYLAELKEYRAKRSPDANAYAWALMGQLAAVLHTTKDEVYLEMLSRYGVYTHLVVKPAVVERVKQEWRTARELGSVKINGKEGVQLQCFFGSSTYDSKEMSVLIAGIVSECEELEIETKTPEELTRLCEEWGK